jgi:RHS repeat-associated protein
MRAAMRIGVFLPAAALFAALPLRASIPRNPLSVSRFDGLPAAASNAASSVAWAYDAFGRAVSETAAVSNLQFQVASFYDASAFATNTALSVESWTLNVERSFDPAGRVSSLATPAGTFRVAYDAVHGLPVTVSNSALSSLSAFDLLGRVTNTVCRNASGAVGSFFYRYDASGFLTQKVSSAGQASPPATNTYAYDALGRLTSADGVAFTYDLAGNRLSAGASSFTYINNRLAGVAHDNAGNVTNMVRGGVTLVLSWNTQGQLISVATNCTFAESYAYDPLGRRAATTTGGTTVYHVYDGVQCVADVNASGSPIRSYTWGQGIDNLLAITVYGDEEPNTYYAVKDHLGSVQALADASGAIVESYTYDAWGNVLTGGQQSAINNRYLWQGREYSFVTGLYNFRARWYAPTIGRWLSKDPIGLEGGLNLYVFCGNDPVDFKDPFGHVAWGQVARGGIGAVVNGVGIAAGAVFAETGAGAVVAVYCAYGVGANVGNIINGIRDTPAGPTGPASALSQGAMLVAGVDPVSSTYRNVDYGAQTTDLAIPLIASGGLDWRLVTRPGGDPGTLAGTLTRVLQDPQSATLGARLAVGVDAALTAGEGIGSAIRETNKMKCP